jgi:outer membrane protein
MKRIVTLAASALFLGALRAQDAAAQAAPQKLGVIEVQRVVQESAVGKESLARVQKLQQGKQDELTRRQKELRDLEQKIQEQGKSLSEDAMDKLQKDYQAKALDLKRFQDDAQRELEEAQRKELTELEKRIMPVIDAVSKEQGYTLIFNKFQSGLLYADPALDVTDAVITKFNTQITAPAKPDANLGIRPRMEAAAPAKPAAPTPAPAPKK